MKIWFFSSHQLNTLFFKICFYKSLLSLCLGYVCVWERGKKKRKKMKERMVVCEERERGVCSMGAYSRRHGITLTLTPKTGISLGKACFYILLCASAVKHVYIILVYLLYLCKYMCVTLVYRYKNKYIRKHFSMNFKSIFNT